MQNALKIRFKMSSAVDPGVVMTSPPGSDSVCPVAYVVVFRLLGLMQSRAASLNDLNQLGKTAPEAGIPSIICENLMFAFGETVRLVLCDTVLKRNLG